LLRYVDPNLEVQKIDGQLSTQLLLSHPPLLLLSPLLLAVFAFTSLPFLTMVVRLGMIGYWRHP
jgi:hypothetical protein